MTAHGLIESAREILDVLPAFAERCHREQRDQLCEAIANLANALRGLP